jgi:large conductance mechanosensitive channel
MKEIKVLGATIHPEKGSKILREFKEFAMRGNVVDLAVGVVIGAAFGKIVTAFVADFITPMIGKLTNDVDLKNMYVSLDPMKTKGIASLVDAQKAGAVIAYGDFVTNVVDFVIVAFFVFMMVKGINVLKRRTHLQEMLALSAPEPSAQEKLLAEIRDLLKAKNQPGTPPSVTH